MSHYQPYAPTPYLPPPLPPPAPTSSSTANTSAPLSIDAEAKLFATSSERELFESLAEIHAILISLEHLEKAYVKDTISSDAYAPVCQRLLSQYHALLADDAVAREFQSLEDFREKWGVECAAAARRIAAGAPGTTRAAGGREQDYTADDDDSEEQRAPPASTTTPVPAHVHPKLAAEATQNFITFMDALRLHYRANDELHPLLAPVVASVDKALEGTEKEWRERGKMVSWLIRLNQGKAGSEISEEEERELLWDVERAYSSFLEVL